MDPFEVVADAADQAANGAVTLRADLRPAPASGKPVLLERMAGNLLENALRYNHAGGHVTVTSGTANGHAALGLLGRQADHRDAERALLAAEWTPCGAGDWAIALRSPDGTAAARISPFDPAGPYSVALYRRAAHTRQVPELFAHRRLNGGGDLQVLEWLRPVPEAEAVAFHRAIAMRAPEVADLADVVRRVHERARRELPWCGPLDNNPANVMRAEDGRLVVADLFYADGPNLYATAATDPDLVVALIPEAERRFMTEIPLAASGPWEPEARKAMRIGLAAADVARASA